MIGYDAEKGLMNRKVIHSLPIRINIKRKNIYNTYYKKFGSNYHLLAQLESMIKGKKAVNYGSGLLQAMFLSEMHKLE